MHHICQLLLKSRESLEIRTTKARPEAVLLKEMFPAMRGPPGGDLEIQPLECGGWHGCGLGMECGE